MRAEKRRSYPNYRAMGFLSRKKKPQPVVEDTHPLEEELKGMEEAVPEPRYVDSGNSDEGAPNGGAPAAGPVADEYSSSSQAAGEEHPSAPPADEAPESHDAGFEGSPAAEERFDTPQAEDP